MQTLERYRIRLDDVSSALSELEVEDVVTLRDVVLLLQRTEMVTPTAIHGLMTGEQVLLTDGQQLRDFSYVDDHVEALLRAAATTGLRPGAIYNIGTGRAVTVREALERIARIVDGPGRLEFGARPSRADDLRELIPDVSAARQDLGFEARVPFDEGVRRTLAWMRSGVTMGDGQS